MRLISGFDLLEAWSEDAGPQVKTVVYEALFSVLDGSVSQVHLVVDDPCGDAAEYIILMTCGVALKIRTLSLDECEIVYIGPSAVAPGLDQIPPDSATPGR